MSFRIESIAIGDEILNGTISDSNSTFIAAELKKFGHRLARQVAIADDVPTIQEVIRERAKTAQLVFVFGGLGPTSDDKTVEAVSELMACPVREHPSARSNIEAAYRKRGQPLNEHALKQALYPANAVPLENREGMAPGFRIRIEGCTLFFLPGVPHEMKGIYRNQVESTLSQIDGFASGGQLQSRVWRCLGIFESQLQLEMDPVERGLEEGEWLGYRTHYPENHLTLYFKGTDCRRFDRLSEEIERILKPWCYSRSDDDLETIVTRQLKTQGARLVVVESCTGGLVTNRLTRIPGASEILWGGVVAYSVEAKKAILNLDMSQVAGPVSARCSFELARHAKQISCAEYSAAVTGFLGPNTPSGNEPLGSIYCAVVGPRNFERHLILTARERERGQWGAASHLLDLIRIATA